MLSYKRVKVVKAINKGYDHKLHII